MNARRPFRILGWLFVLSIGVLSLVDPSLRPVTQVPHDLEHAAIFAASGLALGLGYPNRSALHMAALTVFAAAIEWGQFYVPGRHPRLSDFVVDALGACVGVALAFIVAKLCGLTAERTS